MKKVLILVLGVMTLTACFEKKEKDEKEEQEVARFDSIQGINEQQKQELQDMQMLINQVNEGFRMIREAEGDMRVMDGNREGNDKQQLAENMALVQQTMQQNRELIAQLKHKISSSSSQNSAMQQQLDMMRQQIEQLEQQLEQQKGIIDDLQTQLAERDQVIADQGEQINNLNENVSDLSQQNEEKAATVAAQDRELNTAWFAFGTKSELKEQNILTKGDVLKNGNFNKGYFTEIDIRTYKDIPLYSKSAKVLTNHPAGSYQLVKNGQGLYELHITNPTQFWSVSKYLVIQVK